MPSKTEFSYDDEFGRLEEAGITSSYIEIKNNHVRPIITLAQALAQGFYPRGTKVNWRPNAGYPGEADQAKREIGPNRVLTVKQCTIGSSSSRYEFKEIDGEWNTVMFEKVEESVSD
jgi:hypothetical protein